MKRTYQPSRIHRIRTHGFRARMKTADGRNVIKARRRKGRARLAVSNYQKLPPFHALLESLAPSAASPSLRHHGSLG